MEETNTAEVTSTSISTLDREYIVMPVKAKKEWLQNAFKKKEHTATQPHLRPGNVLVQDRHRWIQEELQLRKTLKSEGKSDQAITHELVQARKRWLDDERKKYHETVIISPGENGKIKRFLQEEKKESDTEADADGAAVDSPTTEIKLVVSQEVVEARKKWLAEEAFGNDWQRHTGVEGNASMLSTLSMQTKVGLATATSEDQVKSLGLISPRDALKLTFKETNTLKPAHTSECDEAPDHFEEMRIEYNSPISNEKANGNTTRGDTYDANASEQEISDAMESPMKSKKTTTDESDKERVVHADLPKVDSCKLSGEQNLDNHSDQKHHYRQQDLMMAPTDERLGLSTNAPREGKSTLPSQMPLAVNRDDWKIVASESDPVDTPCLEVCSIM